MKGGRGKLQCDRRRGDGQILQDRSRDEGQSKQQLLGRSSSASFKVSSVSRACVFKQLFQGKVTEDQNILIPQMKLPSSCSSHLPHIRHQVRISFPQIFDCVHSSSGNTRMNRPYVLAFEVGYMRMKHQPQPWQC